MDIVLHSIIKAVDPFDQMSFVIFIYLQIDTEYFLG